MKQKLLFALCLILSVVFAKAQGFYVNKLFQDSTGSPQFNPILNPLGVQWGSSVTDGSGALIMVGYTSSASQGQNIYLTKHNANGTLAFQSYFNTSGTNNDYGTGLCQASNGDIYVCGTTDNGGTTNYDIVVLHYNSIGALLDSIILDGPASKNDVAVSITEMPGGSIVVAANTEDANGFFDFWILKFNSSLSFIVDNTYDYAGLNDIALGFKKTATGDIGIVGPSFSGATACDYIETVFSATNLAYISETRNNIPGTAFDQALAFCKDVANNTYITGKAWNGSNFDIKTVKITASYAIAWTATLDVHGMDDVASAIAIDPLTGNVIIGGYATKTNNTKEIICARLNASNGSQIGGLNNQTAENASGNAFIKQITTNSSGDVYFVGGELGSSGFQQVIVGKIKANGTNAWQRKIINPTSDILPSDIQLTSSSIYVISVKNSLTNSYLTTAYNELELDTAKANYGSATFKKNELVVRFLASALKKPIIDNTVGTAETEFGDLQTFMTPTAYSQLTVAISRDCKECKISAVRIFLGMRTTDTLETSHLGEPTSVPDFWTALNLVLPSTYAIKDAHTTLNKLPNIIAYAHPNFIARLHSTSNDSLYNQQLSIHSSTLYPNSDVNVEEAWDVIPNGGQPFIRCGIFDTPVDWEHSDFGYNGSNPVTSKIAGGWNYAKNAPFGSAVKSVPYTDISGANGFSHGTAVTGIIGAKRNNIKGVAGIAGGNDSTGSQGISLYPESLFDPPGSTIGTFAGGVITSLSNAIKNSCLDPTTTTVTSQQNYRHKLNIQNHSWGIYTPPSDTGWYANQNQTNTLIQEATHFANRLKVTSIASRGNNSSTVTAFPANCDDDWVICVTGTGIDGKFVHNGAPFAGTNGEFTSSWGGDIDVSAPATTSLVTSLSTPTAGSSSPTNQYTKIYGTSAAAPHVSGAVGLMMSYLNYTVPNYNNMAPEDCEAIIQLSATDIDSIGYDRITGYGRLNIGKAMKLIEKPTHILWHFKTKSPFAFSVTKNLISSVDTIRTAEQWSRTNPVGAPTSFPKGKYIVKTYRINSTVYHNIPTTDTIVSWWPRPSSSVTFPLFTGTGSNKKLIPHEKTKVVGINNNNASLQGYIYQVKDSTGASVGWWPVDTAFINTYGYGEWAEYSVLTKNLSNVIGIKENGFNKNIISIFPNPTNGNQTLIIKTTKVCNLTIDLYDVMGRKLKTVYNGKSEPENTVINHDVANLPNSLYIYNISINGTIISKKFVKQ